MTNHCGTCTACCRVYSIPETKKPAGEWCTHCAIGKGCKIYAARPQVCVEFKCLWLLSQDRPAAERFAPELRPDRCKVVISPSTNPEIMAAMTMPGAAEAWRRGAVHRLLARMVKAGLGVAIGAPNARQTILWTQEGQEVVEMTPPDENGMQWSKRA